MAIASHTVKAPEWRPFDAESLELARREGKLVLLSVQARWCHWCHVMNDVTYRDPTVLALLRESYVAIAVDQDGRPDLAARYENWGWPATVILSAEGVELAKLRGHRPPKAFAKLLRRLREDPEGAVDEQARSGADEAEEEDVRGLEALREQARGQLDRLYDEADGGWGDRQKYPFAAPLLYTLWRAARGEAGQWRARAERTLDGYAQLLDPVAGGMFQYSLRHVWTRPHYEKIASIQAGAIECFTAAFELTGEPLQRARAMAVADYVLGTLRAPEGAFRASQDADVGRVGEPGYMAGDAYYAMDAQGRASVSSPAIDPHVYTDLNGRLIHSLARLAGVRGRGDARYREAALQAATAIDERARDGEGVYRHGGPHEGVRFASDQVQMARAHLALFELTGAATHLRRAEQTSAALLERFVASTGALGTTDEATLGVGSFARAATPLRLNGEAAAMLVRLSTATGEGEFRERALAMLRASTDAEALRREGRKIGELLWGLEAARGPAVKLLVVSEPGEGEALATAALGVFAPEAVVVRARPGETDYPYPGAPVLYACSESACSTPLHDAARVAEGVRAFIAGEWANGP